MYGGKLEAASCVADGTLEDLPVLLFIDTAGCDMEEQREEDGESLRNPGEAEVVIKYVRSLAEKGIPLSTMGIITPYSAQVSLIRSLRNERLEDLLGEGVTQQDLEVSTVDGFQGREKDVIIISMVRSGGKSVGFLAENRRMNVAITRAKKHVALIGDSDTIRGLEGEGDGESFLARLVGYFEDVGEYDSASSYMD